MSVPLPVRDVLLALTAALALGACRRKPIDAQRTDAVPAHDTAASDAVRARVRVEDAIAFGPVNPWDQPLPASTAHGPEADRTRASLDALRASIGFWRVERHRREQCPTLADLRSTPAAAFDPTTMATDAWGTAFTIECQGARVRVTSLGPDRSANTPDDLIAE